MNTNRNFIVAAVVGVAAFDVLPIVVSAQTGSVLMVVTGCLKPAEVYNAVQWEIVFLLAGVIPLGIGPERTGGADLVAELIVGTSGSLPLLLIGVLGLMYLVTALLTNVISNNASVVLMIPVAFETALQVGGDPFAFALAVTFAASTAFMTPVGYQTNLFVYGPGGYRFADYVKVGTPLQLLFAVVTTLGIAFIYGV
jgi:di/tricarboxylate transporter